MDELGKVAYDAYGNSVQWKTVSGHQMPLWEEQHPRLKAAWDSAAQAVARRIGGVQNGT